MKWHSKKSISLSKRYQDKEELAFHHWSMWIPQKKPADGFDLFAAPFTWTMSSAKFWSFNRGIATDLVPVVFSQFDNGVEGFCPFLRPYCDIFFGLGRGGWWSNWWKIQSQRWWIGERCQPDEHTKRKLSHCWGLWRSHRFEPRHFCSFCQP